MPIASTPKLRRAIGNAVVLYGGLFVLMVLTLPSLHRPGFSGDGVGYYAPLASALIDRDLDLRNELEHLSPGYLRAAFFTPEGALGNPFPVGPALLWAPAVCAVAALPPADWLDAPTSKRVRTAHAAFAPRFARAVSWTDVWLVLCGGGVLAGVLASRVHWSVAALSCAAAVFGTPLYYYMLVEPSYGHTGSFFAVALLTSAVLLDRTRRLRLELLGFLVGFAALVRVQDIVFGLMLLPRLRQEWQASWQQPDHAGRLRQTAAWIARLVLPAAFAFVPQMLYWQRIYGLPLLIPPGPDFGRWWLPAVPQFLFSTWNSVLLSAPLMLLGFVGWRWLPDVQLRRWVFVILAAEVYLCSLFLDWWGGAAFGPRRLVSAVPIVACGVALLIDSLRGRAARVAVVVAVLLLCGASVRLGQYTAMGRVVYNPADGRTGRWDYAAWFRDVAQAERSLRGRP